MLPHSDTDPASVGKPAVGVAIARPVRSHLFGPERGVGRRDGVMFRTTVPEAAVQEDRYLCPGEDQVSGSPELLDRPDRYAVTKAEGMDG